MDEYDTYWQIERPASRTAMCISTAMVPENDIRVVKFNRKGDCYLFLESKWLSSTDYDFVEHTGVV